jgi:hypothetical protein
MLLDLGTWELNPVPCDAVYVLFSTKDLSVVNDKEGDHMTGHNSYTCQFLAYKNWTM